MALSLGHLYNLYVNRDGTKRWPSDKVNHSCEDGLYTIVVSINLNGSIQSGITVDPTMSINPNVSVNVDGTSSKPGNDISATEPPPNKKLRTELTGLKLEKNILTWLNKEAITNCLQLNDHYIRKLLSLSTKEVVSTYGRSDTNTVTKQPTNYNKNKIVCGLHIIYCEERNHWVVASGLGSCHNPIKVYDSLFKSIDKETKQVILNVFKKVGKVKIDSVNIRTNTER